VLTADIQQPAAASYLVQVFNRTLYKNFEQKRCVLIVCDEDIRRMFEIDKRKNASQYRM